jgi:hypothetical protein
MGLLKKIMFWKKRKGNISPKMVDVSVSTEARRTCDVATNTEDVSVAGESDSYQAAPPTIYNEENAYGVPSEQYAEWSTIYGPQTDHYAE